MLEKKENVIIHKIKTSEGNKFIFKNIYGTSYMYQFDTIQEAKNYAKNRHYNIVNQVE